MSIESEILITNPVDEKEIDIDEEPEDEKTAAELLGELILAKRDEQSWRKDAYCIGLNTREPNIFFPERGDDVKPAKKICGNCPVAKLCLGYALKFPVKYFDGVWGGTSQNERSEIRKNQQAKSTKY